jgi:hypothetical protein
VREGDGAGGGEGGAHGLEEVRLGLDAAELRGLDEAIEERGDFGATLGPGPVVILSSYDRSSVIPPISHFVRGSATRGIRRAAQTLTFNTGR